MAKTPKTTERMLAADDVVAVYQSMFGREPESDEIVQFHLSSKPTLRAFLELTLTTPEFAARANSFGLNTLRHQALYGQVDVSGSSDQIARLLAHTRKVWSQYGENDPYWSVVTNDRFHAETIDDGDIEAFYASGTLDLQTILDAARRNGVTPNLKGTVLDFGCGLARSGEHLAKAFGHYIGVDISPAHLAQASARCAAKGLNNTSFVGLTDFLDQPVAVDMVLSIIVLQHNPPPVIADLLGRLCEMLAPGGLIMVQIPVALIGYEFKLDAFLANPPANGVMEMHCLPQRDAFRILAEHDVDVLEMMPDNAIGAAGLSVTFFGRKRQDARPTGTMARALGWFKKRAGP